jgi:hypothetical protein
MRASRAARLHLAHLLVVSAKLTQHAVLAPTHDCSPRWITGPPPAHRGHQFFNLRQVCWDARRYPCPSYSVALQVREISVCQVNWDGTSGGPLRLRLAASPGSGRSRKNTSEAATSEAAAA